MKTIIQLFCLAALAIPAFAGQARAQATGTAEFTVYDRARGELSVGTRAPTREDLMRAIDVGRSAPSQLATLLEYGERVECHECVAPLQTLMLDPAVDPYAREMAAWWLRRRPFGFDAVMRETRLVLANDTDPLRRAAAAAAIGEFMDFHGIPHLATALTTDSDARVRTAAVLGIARINSPQGLPLLSTALADPDATVVDAALRSVLRVNFFQDRAALLPLLGHGEVGIRHRAALVIGSMEVAESIPALAAMLRGDTSERVRQAAAWALGRIGTPDARAALNEALASEESRRVLDAVEIALRM